MKLVADEGVDKPIVDALRSGGFEVRYFAEAGAGTGDKEILTAAQEAQSLLLTSDKDFGELVYRQRLTSAGVVLIRLEGLAGASKARLVLDAIEAHGHRDAWRVHCDLSRAASHPTEDPTGLIEILDCGRRDPQSHPATF